VAKPSFLVFYAYETVEPQLSTG